MKKLFYCIFISLLFLSCSEQQPADEQQPETEPTSAIQIDSINQKSNMDTLALNETDNSPFESLVTHVIDNRWPIKVHYNPSISKLINNKFSDDDVEYINVLETHIDSTISIEFIIAFSEGYSADPEFFIYKNRKDTLEQIASIAGTELYIPGNGFLYASGHTNNLFDQKRKFALANGEISEIQQPYYYVGIDSRLEDDMQLYSNTEYKDVVAFLPKGTPVSVLVAQENNFLIKTPFGLVGWIQIEYNPYPGTPIKEIYYAGD